MSKYLHFNEYQPQKGRKTGIVGVFSQNSGSLLGTIKWFGRWRQFTFHPEPVTTFNPECLREIADKTEALTKAHRAGAPA